MRSWLSRSLLVAALFGASWGGAAWYWHATNRAPTATDLVLLLLLLPLTLLIVYWSAKKLLLILSAVPASVAVAPDSAADAPEAPQPRGPVLTILSSAIRVPHGASPEELLEAIISKQAMIELDPELTDDDNFPVMSARMAGVDEVAQEEAMADWLAENGLNELHFNPEQWRALAHGSAVVTELAQSAVRHQLLPDYQQAGPGARSALALPTLLLVPALPAEWNGAQRQCTNRWLYHLIVQQGWPAERLALSASSERVAATPFALIEQLSLQCERAALPCLAIVLACQSHIGTISVHDWAERGTLLTARQLQGQIPGEGAAGLLLADAAQAVLIDAAAHVQMHGASEGRRDASADAKGRTDAALLTALGQQALQEGAADLDQVSLIMADTDQRASRMSELMAMANATLPQLDPETQLIGVARHCGSAGAVSAITALALAHQEVVNNASHVLCVSNQAPFSRGAVIVRPNSPAPV